MTDLRAELKAVVRREIEQHVATLYGISDWMYHNPELGREEHQAADKLTDVLGEYGATITRNIAGMPSAFVANLPAAKPGPKIGIIAEYDALPEVGHGCGHNIIATAALGAAMGLARVSEQLPGAIMVLGTPAEESAVPNAGGKIHMIREGYFRDLAAAIMIHPMTEDRLDYDSSLVAQGLELSFHGKSAHAAANPHDGLNALDALIVMFSSVGLLRQQIRTDARIHGIITHGGTAPNVIPSYTAARFRIRAADIAYTKELFARVIACAEAGAKATGCRLEWHEYMPAYLNMLPNRALGETFTQNLELIGRQARKPASRTGAGSTDLGNVSHHVPAICAYLEICDTSAGWHSTAVADATITPKGHKAILDGAVSMAYTAIDLLLDGTTLDAARHEFTATARFTGDV
ncbi:MAG: Thermostable carboxypeptidase 1 [Chloroflexota bacterium]